MLNGELLEVTEIWGKVDSVFCSGRLLIAGIDGALYGDFCANGLFDPVGAGLRADDCWLLLLLAQGLLLPGCNVDELSN